MRVSLPIGTGPGSIELRGSPPAPRRPRRGHAHPQTGRRAGACLHLPAAARRARRRFRAHSLRCPHVPPVRSSMPRRSRRRWELDMTLRILLVLTLMAISTSVAAADEHRIPLAGSTSELTPVAEGRDGLTFRVAVGELSGLDVGTPAGDFTRLLIPGFHATKTVGAPELPMMNRLIAIPVGARTRIEILSSRSRTIDLADHGIRHRLMPAQQSMPKNADPATWPFRLRAGELRGRSRRSGAGLGGAQRTAAWHWTWDGWRCRRSSTSRGRTRSASPRRSSSAWSSRTPISPRPMPLYAAHL